MSAEAAVSLGLSGGWLGVAMRGVFCVLLLLAGLPAFALEKPEDIRACARKNFSSTSLTQTFLLKSFGRDNSERSMHATAYWKRGNDDKAKVMLAVDSPDDLRGSSYLMLEKATRDDLFMYLPAAARTKRILGNQLSDKLWGTDFSYEDIKQIQGVLDAGKVKREADAEIAGRKAYVLVFEPDKTEESAYRRLVSHIDQATCIALQTDFYLAADKPRKRLTAKPEEVKQQGAYWIAHFYEMRDLHEETRTELRIEKVVPDSDLPDRLFNPQTFHLGR